MRTILIQLVMAAVASSLIVQPLEVAADCKDLDPNAEFDREDEGGQVICRCRSGYVKWNGHCRLVEEVRTRLEERVKNAWKGHKAARDTLKALNSREVQAHVLDVIKSGDLLGGLTRENFLKQFAILVTKMAVLTADIPECTQSNAELRTACENNKNFLRLIQETQIELDKLPTP